MRSRRLRVRLAPAIGLLTILLLSAPPAHAQLGVGDADSVGDQTGEIGDTVNDAIDDTTDTVGDVVGEIGGTVGDTVGGEAGETINDAANDAGETISDTGDEAGDTVGGTVGDIEDTITGGDGGEVIDGDDGTTDPGDDVEGGGLNGSQEGAGNTSDGVDGGASSDPASPELDATNGSTDDDVSTGAGFGRADNVPGSIVDAAKRFAFPLILALLVAVFLAIQNRMDRKDPKLALAMADPSDDHLSFS